MEAVSILVLVDVALKERKSASVLVFIESFNPCFGGCRSERKACCLATDGILGFNPCFGGCRSESQFPA